MTIKLNYLQKLMVFICVSVTILSCSLKDTDKLSNQDLNTTKEAGIVVYFCFLNPSIMKKIAILMCLLVPFMVNAQDDKEPPAKIEWIFNAYFGWATLESNDNYKIQTNAYGAQIGGAVRLNNNLSLIVGVEHLKLYGDHYLNNNQVFDTYNYFKIPVLINYEPNFSRNTKKGQFQRTQSSHLKRKKPCLCVYLYANHPLQSTTT